MNTFPNSFKPGDNSGLRSTLDYFLKNAREGLREGKSVQIKKNMVSGKKVNAVNDIFKEIKEEFKENDLVVSINLVPEQTNVNQPEEFINDYSISVNFVTNEALNADVEQKLALAREQLVYQKDINEQETLSTTFLAHVSSVAQLEKEVNALGWVLTSTVHNDGLNVDVCPVTIYVNPKVSEVKET